MSHMGPGPSPGRCPSIFKVLVFIIVGAIESSLVIKESFLMDQCIDTIKEKIKTENEALRSAKAVHFCGGGHVIDPKLIQ